MPDYMLKEAIDIAINAFEKDGVEKDVAQQIKSKFDKKHGATWQCIIGRNFGSFISYEKNNYAMFYVDDNAVLLFKK